MKAPLWQNYHIWGRWGDEWRREQRPFKGDAVTLYYRQHREKYERWGENSAEYGRRETVNASHQENGDLVEGEACDVGSGTGRIGYDNER